MSALATMKKLVREEHGIPLLETNISLEYHDELNPKLWNGWDLKMEVRQKLLDFAKTWAEFAKIQPKMIKDIIMIGGNTNYNYTPKSDIDVHLVIDRNSVNSNREFVDEYLQDKKMLWTLTHNVTVLGYPIEPYAQDSAVSYAEGQGVFSLKKNMWIQRPTQQHLNFKTDANLKKKVMFYAHMIDQMIKNKMDGDVFADLKKKISDMRSSGIAKGGEFSFENLVFKELRNRGYLDKMNKYEKTAKDQQLSLK